MAKLKDYTLIQIPSYLYRRVSKFDLSMYRRFLPLVLIAEHAASHRYSRPEVEALVDNKLGVYLDLLAEDEKVLVVDYVTDQQVALSPYPVRGGIQGKRVYRVQIPTATLAKLEKLLGLKIPRWEHQGFPQCGSRSIAADSGPTAVSKVKIDEGVELFQVGDGRAYLQRDGIPLQLPEGQARQLAATKAYLDNKSYYLYQLRLVQVETVTPERFFDVSG